MAGNIKHAKLSNLLFSFARAARFQTQTNGFSEERAAGLPPGTWSPPMASFSDIPGIPDSNDDDAPRRAPLLDDQPAPAAPAVTPATATTATVSTTAAPPTAASAVRRPSKRPAPSVADDDANCCSICLGVWHNSGPHQLCCTPCGHLFGFSCIKEWLAGSRKPCPTCKKQIRVKDIRYIFGAPLQLSVVDSGDLNTLRTELRQERLKSAKLEGRMHELKSAAKTYQKQLGDLKRQRAIAIPTFAPTPLAGSTSTAALSSATRRPLHNLQVVSSASQQAAQVTPTVSANHRVKMIESRLTNGGSAALAFDAAGSVLYAERSTRASSAAKQRLTRVQLRCPTISVQSPTEFQKRVNDLSVCNQTGSNYHKYVAAASSDNKLRILNQGLHTAIEYVTPGMPLSCSWVSSQPHLVMAGLANGMVCVFDVRVNAMEALYTRRFRGTNLVAVHSLGELGGTGIARGTILAASPARLEAITFGGFAGGMSWEEVRRNGDSSYDFCCGVTVCGSQIALSSRKSGGGREGRHAVHQGLEISGTGEDSVLRLGAVVGAGGGHLEGHVQDFPYGQCGLVCGDSTGNGTVVMSGDGGAAGHTRVWEYGGKRRGVVAPSWESRGDVGELAHGRGRGCSTVRVVRAQSLPLGAGIWHGQDGQSGMASAVLGTLSDDCVQLYSVRDVK